MASYRMGWSVLWLRHRWHRPWFSRDKGGWPIQRQWCLFIGPLRLYRTRTLSSPAPSKETQ